MTRGHELVAGRTALALVLFAPSRWRKPGVRRMSLPAAVRLNRSATDFLFSASSAADPTYHPPLLGCRHCPACRRMSVRQARRSGAVDCARNEQSRKRIADRNAFFRSCVSVGPDGCSVRGRGIMQRPKGQRSCFAVFRASHGRRSRSQILGKCRTYVAATFAARERCGFSRFLR